MSEIMRPLPFEKLMNCLDEYKSRGTLYGVSAIYRHNGSGGGLETPIGPAAGPHTQLAQNIIAAYAAGARFFELKTVQVMDGDELRNCVARPCILARDEGYNVEWSTELTVDQALAEYVKAYFAINLISRELGLGSPDGFQFNMSVGYDLAGISSPKIDRFIEGMKDARDTPQWLDCLKWADDNSIDPSGISPRICEGITLSTLHGCPPDEIERIADYLIGVKGLNTLVKCNPTLLDVGFVRQTLDDMGYADVQFDEGHFKADLQYADAVPMFKRLMARAREKELSFGVKLTNTMPVKIMSGELPGSEMYMSGKSLYPLTVSLAAKLERDFEGGLSISYCGGADIFNIEDIYACGISPITMATTLLKPGGYNRLNAIAAKLAHIPCREPDWRAIGALAEKAVRDERYMRPVKEPSRAKIALKAPIFDCFRAPCRDACPIGQDAAGYMPLVKSGEYLKALSVICERNPLPNITGTICTHRCQDSCMRSFYDQSVAIRESKLVAAKNGMDQYVSTLAPRDRLNVNVAVIGGGPAGMAAAFFAARAGARVALFEKEMSLGGVVRHVIPSFRISDEAIDADCRLLEALGVDIHLGVEITSPPEGFDHVIVAIGAEKHRATKYASVNAIDFLRSVKSNTANIGKSVIVVGGGNTAMDAARAARRLGSDVTIVYRRRVSEMPAEYEELKEALDEGVKFVELRSPVSFENGVLSCEVMRLGDRGPDGRRVSVATGEMENIPADAVIAAIGETIDGDLLSRFPGCVVIGDAKLGPATVVEAIANAMRAIDDILPLNLAGELPAQANPDARRQGGCDCLGCEGACLNCVDVCPNRANVAIDVDGRVQILHIDRLCNECGNCSSFCPYEGAPFRDKFTAFETTEDFEESALNQGFLPLTDGRVLIRLDSRVEDVYIAELAPEIRRFIEEALKVI